jgi:RNA polymerase sigma-70 factor (ECF subfamily)
VAARTVGVADAEDVSQDAFLRAFHRLGRFRGDGSFRSWLLQITHNTAVNAVARVRPEPVAEERELPDESSAAGEREPAEHLERDERRRRLERKLRSIRPEHRAPLVLRDVEGLPYEEIASITGAPLGSVKGRIHRGRGELIELLRNNTYDWDLPR